MAVSFAKTINIILIFHSFLAYNNLNFAPVTEIGCPSSLGISSWNSSGSGCWKLRLDNFGDLHVDLFIAPGILPASLTNNNSLLWARPNFGLPYRPRACRSLQSSFIGLLLLLGGDVSVNPGPSTARPHPPQITIGCYNARSAVNKAALLHDLINDRRIDLLALTETWVTSHTPRAVYADLAPPGYAVLNVPREIRRGGPQQGGGLAVVFRDSIIVRPLALTNLRVKTFEVQIVRLRLHMSLSTSTARRQLRSLLTSSTSWPTLSPR